jgi:hypothetical protein
MDEFEFRKEKFQERVLSPHMGLVTGMIVHSKNLVYLFYEKAAVAISFDPYARIFPRETGSN